MKRLSHYIQEHIHPKSSLKEIKRAIEENRCLVNGKIERFHSYRVKPDDVVECELSLPKKLLILYEDDRLAVIDKPPFVVSDVEKGLLGWHLAHRLDKETSGCLLLAKDKEILSDLENLFRKREVQKEYLAVSAHLPLKASGVIQDPIRGQKAITSWKRGKAGKRYHFIECKPETGRTHQIRIHLSRHGMPIVGDTKYGVPEAPWNRVLLHSKSLAFQHPVSDKPLLVKSPLPKEFYEALDS